MTHTNDAGFTLLEMLVAVVVLSIALGGALEALSGFSGTQARLQERYCAHLVAWKDAVHYSSGDQEGSQSGFSEQCGVDWEVNISETKIISSEEDEDEDGEVSRRIPIIVTSRIFNVYSPIAGEDKKNISAQLRSLQVRISQ